MHLCDHLTNYYDILGLPSSAGSDEIKAAFRRLAKQYHPDRNPNGKELFERVLLAYETLSDPAQKSAYDYQLRSGERHFASGAQPVRPQGKNWKFDEREMKRRQYYNEHIRKYAKETASYNARAREKKNYNEYKYILLATPLAALLFVIIMKVAGPTRPARQLPYEATNASVASSELRPGDSPYNFIFGSAHYDTANGRTLFVKNHTGLDAIVCIFSAGKFIRGFFIQGGFSAEVSDLPPQPVDIRYAVGQEFNYRKKLKKARVVGGFKRKAAYYRSSDPLLPSEKAVLTLLPGINEGFVKTGEKDFFDVRP